VPDLVATGAVPIATVDTAVRRILSVKIAAGLLDNPYRSMDQEQETARILPPSTRALAREAATRSIVLLRNEGSLLPLNGSERIALIGPFGQDVDNVLGPWSFYGEQDGVVDIATGLRKRLRDPRQLEVVRGSAIEHSLPGGIERAVAAARNADVV